VCANVPLGAQIFIPNSQRVSNENAGQHWN
jgi:hypothetical protein